MEEALGIGIEEYLGVDHSRGLCGKPDVPNDTAIEVVKANPAHCLCCGSEMYIQEPSSIGMQQLGIYAVYCPTCPSKKGD